MYFASDKMVLRMYQARVVSEADTPGLNRMVDRLRQRAGLPMAMVAVALHEQPNAFATGRNPEPAVACIAEGILRLISREELEMGAHRIPMIDSRQHRRHG